MEFRVLGPLQVLEDDRPLPLGGRRQRMVLAALLVHANEVVSTDRLIDDVWGEEPPATARKSLQVYVSRLRKLFGNGTIEAQSPGYVLDVDETDLDAGRFAELSSEGRHLLATDPEAAAAKLRDALAMWFGRPWGDLADEPAQRADAQRLGELRLTTLEDRIEADLALGEHASVVGELEELVASHPMRERARALLMLALYRDGRQAEALRVYQDTRRMLAEELGIEPSASLQRLENQILLHDPSLDVEAAEIGPAPPVTVRNPYKGLRPFDEGDAGDFFGRDDLVAELVRRVDSERFVALVGASGSGKSSVVRAGLISALRAMPGRAATRRVIALMLPGGRPFMEFEAALLRASTATTSGSAPRARGDDLDVLRSVLWAAPDNRSELVLVIDQFEELFVLVEEEERARFIRNLVEAVEDPHSRFRVVVTLRADFFDRPLAYAELGALLTGGQVNVLPITAAGLEAAAVRPAAGVGVAVEPELVAELVSDVANHPGVLPQFQFVLTELFDRRRSDILTLAGYRAIGGLRGALSRRADELCERLDAVQMEATRQVFLRLVTPGEGTEDTRRRVRRCELEILQTDRDAVETTIRIFGDARLLTFDRDAVSNEPTVEVAHEALLRGWPRLRSWIDQARDDLRIHRSLAAATAEWTAADRDPDYLLTGSHLATYEDWSASSSIALTETEEQYLGACRDHRDKEAAADRARREHERWLERRAMSRLRVLVAVLAVAAVVAVALTVFALNRSGEAERQAELATAQAEEARLARDDALVAGQTIRINELIAQAVANRNVDPELGLLLVLHAVNISDAIGRPVPAETVAAFHWVLQAAGVQYPFRDRPAVAIAGPEGTRGIFRVGLPELVALARDNISRSLSPDECEMYLGTADCPVLPAAFSPALAAADPAPIAADPTRPLAGTLVTINGATMGAEADAFRADMERFTDRTGINVEYESLGDYEPRLVAMVAAGTSPDITLAPQPSFVAWLGAEGAADDLGLVVDVDALRAEQSAHLVSLGTFGRDASWPSHDGTTYGALFRAQVKGLVWYPVPEFHRAGYEIPTTWDELMSLTEQMVADGHTPWCHGERSPGASGWPGTDWIEDILLHEAGPSAYDGWVAHTVSFEDPEVRRAFAMLGEMLLEDGHVLGGQEGAANTSYLQSQHPMFDDPPKCWLYHGASFTTAWFPYGAVPGRDAAFFPLPEIDPQHGDAVLGAGELVVALADRPEVRETLRYILGPDFGYEMSKRGVGFLSPRRDFPADEYQICEEDEAGIRSCVPNEISADLGALVARALAEDAFRYDGSDLMPQQIGTHAFWGAMVRYVGTGPDNVDAILAELEETWDRYENGNQ